LGWLDRRNRDVDACGQWIERRHVEEVILREILENLIEGNPNPGSGNGIDGGAQILGQGFDKILDGDFHMTLCELGVDGGKGKCDAGILRRVGAGLENRGGEEKEDGRYSQGDAVRGRRHGCGLGRRLGWGSCLHGRWGFDGCGAGGWLRRSGRGYFHWLFHWRGRGGSFVLDSEEAEEIAGLGDGFCEEGRRVGFPGLDGWRSGFNEAAGLGACLGDLIAGDASGSLGPRAGEADLFE
jgi:hypothetical protein